MEYRRFQNMIIVRIDKDEEITEQLHIVSEKEDIKLASVEALGAINSFTVGGYDAVEKNIIQTAFKECLRLFPCMEL